MKIRRYKLEVLEVTDVYVRGVVMINGRIMRVLSAMRLMKLFHHTAPETTGEELCVIVRRQGFIITLSTTTSRRKGFLVSAAGDAHHCAAV
jgi:hypothetical protein